MAVARQTTANTIQAAVASPASHAFTVDAGNTNVCAFAVIMYDQAAGMSISAVTLGGQSMTAAGAAAHSSTQDAYAEVWYLANPPTGTPTLSITVAGTVTDIYYNLVVFTGVNQVTPVRAGTYQNVAGTTTAGGQFSLVVSSNTIDLTLTAINSPGGNTGTNQTSDGITTAGAYSGASDHATAAASSVTHTWSGLAATGPIAIVGLSINGDPSTGGAWAPVGTRRAPAQIGPFDLLGFLRQQKFDYTPATVTLPAFLPPPAFVLGRTRSERAMRHQLVAHGHFTTGAPLLRPNRVVTPSVLLLARDDKERQLARQIRSSGRATTWTLAASRSPVLPRFADLAPPVILEARARGAKRLRQVFDRDHHWITTSRLLSERSPVLPRFADLASATILLEARAHAVRRLKQLLASRERITVYRWLPPPIPPAPILNHGVLLLAREHGGLRAHLRHEKNRSTLQTWLPYRLAPIRTPGPLWWKSFLEENRGRGMRRLKSRHDAADVFAFAYLPIPKPPAALNRGALVDGRLASEWRLRIRRAMHALLVEQLPLPVPRPPKLGRIVQLRGRLTSEHRARWRHELASVRGWHYESHFILNAGVPFPGINSIRFDASITQAVFDSLVTSAVLDALATIATFDPLETSLLFDSLITEADFDG